MITIRQVLQFAVPAHLAEHTEVVALREEQIQYKLPSFYHLRRFGLNHQTIGNREGTGRLQGSLFFDFDQAYSTRADGLNGGMVT